MISSIGSPIPHVAERESVRRSFPPLMVPITETLNKRTATKVRSPDSAIRVPMLTERQKADLHVAILEYLRDGGKGLAQSAESFAREVGLETADVPKSTGTLEKKWTAVVRLQKKVMELEERLANTEQELKTSRFHPYGVVGVRPLAAGGARNLPRAPAVQTLVGHRGGVTCLTTHPVFALLVSGSEDSTIKTWDLESGVYEKTLKGHTNGLQSLVFNRAGTLLASCSSDLSIKIWDFGPSATVPDCLRTLRGHDHNISGLIFLGPSDAQLVSCSRDTTVKIWEVSTGYCLRTLTEGHTDWVRCLAASEDGALVASGGNDQTIVVWNLSTGSPTLTLREHTHVVESLAFPPVGTEVKLDDKCSSSSSSSSSTTTTNTTTIGKAGNSISGRAVRAYLVSGGRDKTVKLWDAVTGQCLSTFSDHDNWVRSVCFHPSGQYILSVSDDRSMRVFDIARARCVRTIADAHSQFVTALTQHVVLPYVATGSVDREIKVWECR